MSSEPPPSNVTVKMKRGAWEIEITSPPDKVQQAVESVMPGWHPGSRSRSRTAEPTPDQGGEKRFETCRGLLQMMWKEGWFGSEKTLSESTKRWPGRGYRYDRTAVSHALVDLVQRGDALQGRDDAELQVRAEAPAELSGGRGLRHPWELLL